MISAAWRTPEHVLSGSSSNHQNRALKPLRKKKKEEKKCLSIITALFLADKKQ